MIKTSFRTIDGLTIRYAESAPHDRHALLLSPWPESLHAYDQMWTRLAGRAHLVAIDLPGFGHSDRSPDLLNPSAMGEFVVRVADEFGLEQPHAVGPDVGTSALLFAAAKHPGRFRSLVVGNGSAAVPLQLGGILKTAVEAPDLSAFGQRDPRESVAAVLGLLEHYDLPADVREDYLSAYAGDGFVESLEFIRSYRTELPLLSGLLPEIETPVRIIAGDHDGGVLAANATFLRERLPESRIDWLEAGHFVYEDRADAYAELVTDWWERV
ncbi:alpha/beta fold hydrolase [Actinoplanes solisilvae]|uniref:alpha/beta fold hydrolase n=1 Tax=Actinoplanes solisilvae TaxID=2486853 RepID=UPI000FD8A00F|nr:alpha/beta hydrolase [Actinoplanes solisilvae]